MLRGSGRRIVGKRLGVVKAVHGGPGADVKKPNGGFKMSLIRSGSFVWLGLTFTLLAWTESRAQPTVYVVNYPLQYFAERIGGEQVKVVFPAPGDTDPAFWKPDVSTIAAFQSADLILVNGAGYARWIQTASLPKSRIIHTSRHFEADYIEVEDTTTHRHGPSGEHAHAGTAFTTWLDFRQAAQQAQAVMDGLSRLLPEQKGIFEQRYARLEQDLLALDERLHTVVSTRREQPWLASHPVYQYLARRYGLNLHSVLWEPDTMPSDQQWEALQDILKTHAATWMLWEDDPLPAAVEKLQALGVKSLVFDPCGNSPGQDDFLSVMQQNVARLQQAFQ